MINDLRNRLAYYLVSIVKIIAGRGFVIAASAKVGIFDWRTVEAKKVGQHAIRDLIHDLEAGL